MVNSMLKKAKETNADIVCCDYFVNYKKGQVYKSHNYINNNFSNFKKEDYLKSILSIYISVSLCDKLVKKILYNKVTFPLFSYGEDSFICLQLFYNSSNILHLDNAFYHYNKINYNSITFKNENNIKDLKEFSMEISNFLVNKKLLELNEYHIIGLLELVISSSLYNFKNTYC